jgi:hypothetical protein
MSASRSEVLNRSWSARANRHRQSLGSPASQSAGGEPVAASARQMRPVMLEVRPLARYEALIA